MHSPKLLQLLRKIQRLAYLHCTQMMVMMTMVVVVVMMMIKMVSASLRDAPWTRCPQALKLSKSGPFVTALHPRILALPERQRQLVQSLK